MSDEFSKYKRELDEYSRHKRNEIVHTLDEKAYIESIQCSIEWMQKVMQDDCDLDELLKYEEWLEGQK